MQPTFDALIAASARVCWTLDEVIPEEGKLDFSKPFLPEGLVQPELDLANVEVPIRRTLPPGDRAQLIESQKTAYKRTFVTWGTNKTEDVALIEACSAQLA